MKFAQHNTPLSYFLNPYLDVWKSAVHLKYKKQSV